MIYFILITVFFFAGFFWGAFLAIENTSESKPPFSVKDEHVLSEIGWQKGSWTARKFEVENGDLKTTTYKCYRN